MLILTFLVLGDVQIEKEGREGGRKKGRRKGREERKKEGKTGSYVLIILYC